MIQADNCALVVGAGGGIGEELVRQMAASGKWQRVVALSRQQQSFNLPQVLSIQLDSAEQTEVADFVSWCRQQQLSFSCILCCIGKLHEPQRGPEKKLEDISPAQLLEYFRVNTVLPAIWLQQGLRLLNPKLPAHFVFFSARVGSISDNRLGGWYGYRASKAALNMLVKTAQVEYQRRLANTSLLCYHPGTVDTALSKPFQANLAKEQLFTPAFTVSRLLSLLAGLSPDKGPYYLDWQGKPITW